MKPPSLLFFLFCFPLIVQARTWTASDGRTMEADFVRGDDNNVTIKRGGKEFTLPLDKISQADREYVATKVAEAPAASAPAKGSSTSSPPKPQDVAQKDAIQLGSAYTLAISPDSKLIVTGGYQRIKFWDATTGKQEGECENEIGNIYFLLFSSDGLQLIAGGDSGRGIIIYDVSTRKAATTLLFKDQPKVVPLGFTQDGKGLVVGRDKDISILSLPDGTVSQSIAIPENIEAFVLLPGAQEVVTIGKFVAKLDAWDLKTGQKSAREFKQDKEHTPSSGGKLTVAGTDTLAVASFMDRKLFLFDLRTGSPKNILPDIQQASFTKDGKAFAEGTWHTLGENFVNLFETSSGKNLVKIGPYDKDTVLRAFLSDDCKVLAAVPSGLKPILVWHLK